MAIGTWQISDDFDTSNQYIKYRICCLENSTSTANNSSNVRITVNIWRTNTGYTTYGVGTVYVTINGTQYTQAITSSQLITYDDKESNYFDKTLDIPHETDGTKTLTVSAYISHDRFSSSSHSTNFSMTNIPRQTSITTFTVNKRNETSFTFNWGTADTIDYLYYSTNNGSSWTGLNVTDGTSGSFTVSGLSTNTTYKCKIRVRRKDSQLTTDSSAVSQTTYKVPTQSLSSKTETKITMSWSIDSTADYIWYSTNNGSSWTAVGSVNATSGSYTISGLSPNTTYNVKTRVRRKASQTTYDTTASSQTTYKVPTQSLNTKTLTTIKINWSCDTTVDYIWYSSNNGSSWTGLDVTDGTSGSYTISSLSPNTTYNIKTRCRRKATQTTYDTTALSVTTYDIAKISTAPNIDHGNNLTVTYTNPSGSAMHIALYNTAGSTAYAAYRSCTGTSYTFTFTDTELDTIYKQYGTNNSFKARVYLRTANAYWNYKEITITLKGNQKTAYVGASGKKRAKVWVGVSGTPKRAVVWIGNNGRKRCI